MVEVLQGDGPETLRLVGELDLATVSDVEMDLAPYVAQPGPLSLDLSGLNFMGSEGIRLFIRIAGQRMKVGPLVLFNPSPSSRRVLHLAGMENLPNLVIRNAHAPGRTDASPEPA